MIAEKRFLFFSFLFTMNRSTCVLLFGLLLAGKH